MKELKQLKDEIKDLKEAVKYWVEQTRKYQVLYEKINKTQTS